MGFFYQNVSLCPWSNLERSIGEKSLSLMEMRKNTYMRNSHFSPFFHAYFPPMSLFMLCV